MRGSHSPFCESNQQIRTELKPNDKIELLEQLFIAAHVINDDGLILWANPYEIDILGYSSNEYVGQNFSNVRINMILKMNIYLYIDI